MDDEQLAQIMKMVNENVNFPPKKEKKKATRTYTEEYKQVLRDRLDAMRAKSIEKRREMAVAKKELKAMKDKSTGKDEIIEYLEFKKSKKGLKKEKVSEIGEISRDLNNQVAEMIEKETPADIPVKAPEPVKAPVKEIPKPAPEPAPEPAPKKVIESPVKPQPPVIDVNKIMRKYGIVSTNSFWG